MAIFVLGAVIRFHDLDRLTLRIDEIYTLLYIHLSWTDVTGLNGYYDAHPPLFYTLSKAASVVVGDELGVRVVAALAGSLTVAVLFVMVARLLDVGTAAVSATLLAVAPMHVEASRDGRMYAPIIFAVLLSYACLLEWIRSPSWRWAAAYGASLAFAVYLDYAALFPLVPQLVLIGVALRLHPSRRRTLIACALMAMLSYAPWLPELWQSVDALTALSDSSDREDNLGLSWASVRHAVPYILGLDSRGSSSAAHENVWDRWQGARAAILALVLAAGGIGLVALRRRPIGLIVAVGLALGAPLTAAAVSLFTPAFAIRTIQIALLGWCIAVAWLIARLARIRWRGTAIAAVLLAGAITLSWVTLPATLSARGRYEWRGLANFLIEHNQQGRPVILLSSAGTLTEVLELYGGDAFRSQRVITVTDGRREVFSLAHRWIHRGPTRDEVEQGALVTRYGLDDPAIDAVWFASRHGRAEVAEALTALGFREVLGIRYIRGDIWLYAHPFALIGQEIDVNGSFQRGVDHPDGWAIAGGDVRLEPGAGGARRLVLPGDGAAHIIEISAPVSGSGIYTATVQVSSPDAGQLNAKLSCLGASGRDYETDEELATVAAGSTVQIMLGVQCRPNSTEVRLTLTRSGPAEIAIERVMVAGSPGDEL